MAEWVPASKILGGSSQLPVAELEGLLHTAETIILRMIVGVFKFALARLPIAIYDVLVSFFPTVVRIVRVLVLLALQRSD